MKQILLWLFIGQSLFPSNWLNYRDVGSRFSIEYPENWEKRNELNIVVFLSPKESSTDTFQENLNIMTQNISKQPITLDEYVEMTRKDVIKNFGVSSIVSLRDVQISGKLSKEFVYTMYYQGKKLKIKQYTVIVQDIIYLVTFSSEIDKYTKYGEIANRMILGLKLFS